MTENNISEMTIIYDSNGKNNINIFGIVFVHNNKNIVKMIIDNKEYEIEEKYKAKINNNDKLKIKLKGINNVTNMSNMFFGCSSLSYLPDISKWNTNNDKNMRGMLDECLNSIL